MSNPSRGCAKTWMLQVAELGILLHIAENAACISTVTGSHVAYHFSQMLERARSVMLELQDFIRLQLLKDPDSFSDETRKLEIRWNVWLLKESKVREMAANMSAARQNIASALTALTAVSTCVAFTDDNLSLANQRPEWRFLA